MYLSAVLAVVVGVIVASLYTAYFNHRASQNDIIKDYLDDLDVIETLCAEYWLYSGSVADTEEIHERIGHELRAKIEATSIYAELSQKILGDQFEKFSALDVELFMRATGGNFQTKNFQRSPEVYGEIMSTISQIRMLLRSKRNAMFWAK